MGILGGDPLTSVTLDLCLQEKQRWLVKIVPVVLTFGANNCHLEAANGTQSGRGRTEEEFPSLLLRVGVPIPQVLSPVQVP